MRTLDAGVVTALQARTLRARNLFWFTVKDRDTDAPTSLGLWNEVGTVTLNVIDAYTGSSTARTFYGAGSLIDIPDIPLTADLTVREIGITLNGIDDVVANAIRGYEPKLAPVQIYRALFNVNSWTLVAPAVPRFVGFIDTLTINTPPEGEFGSIAVKLVSQLRELTRANPDVRSDESQRARSTGDRFFEYAEEVGEWKQWWGKAKGRLYRS